MGFATRIYTPHEVPKPRKSQPVLVHNDQWISALLLFLRRTWIWISNTQIIDHRELKYGVRNEAVVKATYWAGTGSARRSSTLKLERQILCNNDKKTCDWSCDRYEDLIVYRFRRRDVKRISCVELLRVSFDAATDTPALAWSCSLPTNRFRGPNNRKV